MTKEEALTYINKMICEYDFLVRGADENLGQLELFNKLQALTIAKDCLNSDLEKNK